MVDRRIQSIGFTSGLLAFAFTAAFVVVQVMQLRRLLLFPFDEILIYGTSLCIVIPYLLEILALHYTVSREKKFYSHAAVLFSVLYAVFVSANYVVQLGTVIPMKLNGATEDVQVLIQTPHSMFWNFDAVGYICMGLTSVVILPIFKNTGFDRYVRWSLMANAMVTPLIAIVYFAPAFSEKLLLLGFPWALTAPLSMIMVAFFLRKSNEPGPPLSK